MLAAISSAMIATFCTFWVTWVTAVDTSVVCWELASALDFICWLTLASRSEAEERLSAVSQMVEIVPLTRPSARFRADPMRPTSSSVLVERRPVRSPAPMRWSMWTADSRGFTRRRPMRETTNAATNVTSTLTCLRPVWAALSFARDSFTVTEPRLEVPSWDGSCTVSDTVPWVFCSPLKEAETAPVPGRFPSNRASTRSGTPAAPSISCC